VPGFVVCSFLSWSYARELVRVGGDPGVELIVEVVVGAHPGIAERADAAGRPGGRGRLAAALALAEQDDGAEDGAAAGRDLELPVLEESLQVRHG
jgi:hypothetical protein